MVPWEVTPLLSKRKLLKGKLKAFQPVVEEKPLAFEIQVFDGKFPNLAKSKEIGRKVTGQLILSKPRMKGSPTFLQNCIIRLP